MLRAASPPFPIPFGYTGQPQPYTLSRSALPMISVSTGSMGNNGALTGLTALATTYANAYIYLPANAISAGSAAGWYFCQMSSTTAGTVFNNTYTTGTPTIPSSPTPFVTTGPGAFTGDTTEQGVIITVPAGAIGLNGELRIWPLYSYTNNGNTKTVRVRLGGLAGTIFFSAAVTATNALEEFRRICNRGVANSQVGLASAANPFVALGANPVYGAIDTSVSTSVAITVQKATATDNAALEAYLIELVYSA